MNKDLYRIVFNRALGLLQVVAEIARRPGGQGDKSVSRRSVEATVPSMRFASVAPAHPLPACRPPSPIKGEGDASRTNGCLA